MIELISEEDCSTYHLASWRRLNRDGGCSIRWEVIVEMRLPGWWRLWNHERVEISERQWKSTLDKLFLILVNLFVTICFAAL